MPEPVDHCYSLPNMIHAGDAQTIVQRLPARFASTVVTSPPYYGQRNYTDGHEEEIGVENSIDRYVGRLVDVFRECRRVLQDDGTLWLCLGDKYSDGRLLGAPWRVALALQDDGWYLRSDIIWHKPNAMPSSVTNRPTTDHEYLFLLTKQPSGYYYNADVIREPHITFTQASRMKGGRGHFGRANGTPESGKNGGDPNLHKARWDQAFHPLGRNKRTVWSVPLSKSRDAHFAVFPERLVEPCVMAGSPVGGLVLDPFVGTGTTALVAATLGRSYVGIDINSGYCDMAARRLAECQTRFELTPSRPLPATAGEDVQPPSEEAALSR
ncbi:MAG: DNA-methyltransferase [Candidatus Limnocylindrales bacterium]